MPTYEYQCTACQQLFEYFQRISDSPKTSCEACGGKLEKLVSGGSGLIFKGSGFYITDYKKSGSANTAPSKPETESKSSSSSESKPAESKTSTKKE